jgi:hypothetical protein
VKYPWLALMLLAPALSASAQLNDKKYVVAVHVDSTNWQIQQMLPELRDEAVKVVEHSADDVRAAIVLGSPVSPGEQARQKEADYLLTIDLSLASQVVVAPGGRVGEGPPTTANVPVYGGAPTGLNHSHCEDLLGQAFSYSYKVTDLSGKKLKIGSFHTMQEFEYPLDPISNCLPRFSLQAVRISAADAVRGLKSKKKI